VPDGERPRVVTPRKETRIPRTLELAGAALALAISLPGSAAQAPAPGVTPAMDYSGDWTSRHWARQ